MQQRYATEPQAAPDPGGPRPPSTQPLAFELTTLAELGPNLPVGVLHEGRRHKGFRLRPWRLKEEKALSKMKEETKPSEAAGFVLNVLAYMIQTLGPYSFDAMKEGERQLALSQMLFGDVAYLYFYLRYQALGPEEPCYAPFICPTCRHQDLIPALLGPLSVRTLPETAGSLRRAFTLRDSMMIRGVEAKTLYLEPFAWSALVGPDFASKSNAEREALTLMGSIVGADTWDKPGPVPILEEDLDELTKFDLEGLIADITLNTPGPQLGLDARCPNCRINVIQTIDWSWDRFFSRSVLRKNGRP